MASLVDRLWSPDSTQQCEGLKQIPSNFSIGYDLIGAHVIYTGPPNSLATKIAIM